jgi:ATP-binding protein involved in chromosome partitioning
MPETPIKDILEALRQVKHRETGEDIVSAKMVHDLQNLGGVCSLVLVYPGVSSELRKELTTEIKQILVQLPGIKEVRVAVTEQLQRPERGASTVIPEGIKYIFAVASGKGGVGKSTVAANIAVALAQEGHKVGLLDCDMYGPSVPQLFGLSGPVKVLNEKMIPIEGYGVKTMSIGFIAPMLESPVMWRGPIVSTAIKQLMEEVDWGALDCLVVDMPPGTGDAQMTLAQQTPIAGVVIVTTPQKLASEIAAHALRMFRIMGVPVLGIVENMSRFECPGCKMETRIFPGASGEQIAEENNTKLLGSVALSLELMAACEDGVPYVERHRGEPIAQEFRSIARNVVSRLKAKSALPEAVVN